MMKKRIAFVLVLLVLVGSATAFGEEGMISMDLFGPMGERFEANMENWLLTAPYHNPGMVQMYFRRNQPHQDLVPWYGEFSGKYLTSASLSYMMHPDARLAKAINYVVDQLAAAQDEDGYLGPWPDSQKLNGCTLIGDKTWDAWGHYHNMMGLYLWHKATGSEKAWNVLNKALDCLHNFYIVQQHAMDEDKDGTDTAIAHVCALLYQETGDQRCMDLVKKAFDTFETILGGNYYNAGLEGKPFYRMQRTRWECLHAIQTIKAMYDINGEEKYKISFSNIWDGILKNDRHNTGGFSSGERACGNPYDLRAIETCCTIAWMALTADMLDLSDDSYVADELELSTWNGLLGAQQANGRSFTYNTPMIGDKKASAHEIVFQAVAGSSELNCCSVNGPRGIGMIGEWGVTVDGEQITVNYYGASETTITTAGGRRVTVLQSGSYPFGSDLKIQIKADADYAGNIRLRIPFWSENTVLLRNGKAVECITPRSYFTVEQAKDGDVYELTLDMSPHFWQGNMELGGKTSIYLGPILMAADQRFNDGMYENFEPLKLSELVIKPAECPDTLYPAPYRLVNAIAGDIRIVLCDFASAGQTGTMYTTWLPTEKELKSIAQASQRIQWGQRIDPE